MPLAVSHAASRAAWRALKISGSRKEAHLLSGGDRDGSGLRQARECGAIAVVAA
jgi:hypothetical protein